jgi:CHASE3 domain sensor protein
MVMVVVAVCAGVVTLVLMVVVLVMCGVILLNVVQRRQQQQQQSRTTCQELNADIKPGLHHLLTAADEMLAVAQSRTGVATTGTPVYVVSSHERHPGGLQLC